ncbi:MAG: hypothetical protein ABIQ08_01680 [Duganella sp.]
MALSAKPYLQSITARFGDDVDWNRHPYNVPAVGELESLSFHADVTFFIGENGAGITEVAYEDTEHFAITRDFLNHYPRRLQQLLELD